VKDQAWRVPVTGLATNEALSIKKGKLILKSADVKEILEPVVAQVVKLVLEQIRTTSGDVKAVLLVGGFGMSMYLRERIKEEVSKKIEVLQPPYGWSAVVRGAVLKGLAQSDPKHTKVRLTSRIARKHLGTCCGVIFDERIHSASRKFVSIPCLKAIIKEGISDLLQVLRRLRWDMEDDRHELVY
jgi:molecular chaperone DnaK (HSP70)